MELNASGKAIGELAKLTWFKLVAGRRLFTRLREVRITDRGPLTLRQVVVSSGK